MPGTDPPIGAELLGYRIESVLGRGGMGIVYLAQDLRLKRHVALKLLSPELAEADDFRERLLRESELAASLDHPNIVPIYQAGESDGRIFISMRYVPGSDLKRLLREGPLAADRALAIVAQVAGALDAAHLRGLVHRDVKPSNILVAAGEGPGGGDHVYLADFGLSMRRAGDHDVAAGDEELLGTIEYVAPEQIRGVDVDGRADVYALGCVLFECLAGRPPFADRSDAAILFAHLREGPPALAGLEEVLPKVLAKSPDDRYDTCGEFVDAARSSLGLTVREAPKRRRWLTIAVGALVVAAVVIGAILTRGGGAGAGAATGRLIRIDPHRNKAVGTVAVGRDPSGVAAGAGGVWMTSLPDDALYAVDPKTLATKRISVGGIPFGVAVKNGASFGQPTAGAVSAGLVFVAGQGGVTMIDPGSDQPTGTLKIGDATVIAGGGAGIWVVSETADRVVDTSFGLGKVTAKIRLTPAGVQDEAHARSDETGIAVGEGAVWVLGDDVDRHLWRIDPVTRRVSVVALPAAPGGVAAGLGAVWVTAQLDDKLLRIDPDTGKVVATIRVGHAPLGVAAGAGGVWVANTVDGTVSRIDPRTNRVVATIVVGASPTAVAVGEGSVWVAARAL